MNHHSIFVILWKKAKVVNKSPLATMVTIWFAGMLNTALDENKKFNAHVTERQNRVAYLYYCIIIELL